jgi:two-component system sensor kinase FixL
MAGGEPKGEMRVESAQNLTAMLKDVGSFFAPSYNDVTVSEDDSLWPEISFAVIFAFATGAAIAIEAFSSSSSLRYHLPIAVAVLLITEAILLGAVLRHDWRRRTVVAFLKENEERTNLAAESAGLGVWRWDSVSDTFWANRTCQEMLGLKEGHSYSADAVMALISPEDRPAVDHAAQHALRSGSPTELEFRVGREMAEPRWLLARAIPLPDSDNLRVSGTILDVTERKDMQFEVEQQKQSLAHLTRVGMISELSSALAHELNQPLSAILSNAQAAQRILKKGVINTEALGEAISDIIEDDTRASEVIRHLRTFLKDDASSVKELDLNDTITNTLELTKTDLINRHITVLKHLLDGKMTINGDPVQLQQVILNIILNAAQSMDERKDGKGVLLISTDILPGRTAHLAISDNGPGISDELKEKLFEPFFSSKKSGMGLGLSISRSIVARHRGRIWAVSNRGQGATFHVSLPLSNAS